MMPEVSAKLKVWSCICFIVLFLTAQYCSEPFEFDIEAEQSDLVVDGFITDQFKRHLIRLSHTSSKIDEISSFTPVRLADVSLQDDQGRRYPLESQRNGNFFTPFMSAEEGRSYQLTVRVGGRTYNSTFESLPEANFTPDLQIDWNAQDYRNIIQGSLLISRPGLVINAQINKAVNTDTKPVHYQWFVSDCRLYNGLPLPGQRGCQVFGDITRQPKLYLHQDNYIPRRENETYLKELTWIAKPNSANVSGAYLVEIDQLIISEAAYNYWSKINNIIESKGTIFEPQGSRILGNIENTASGNLTLGFFGVYRESSNWERIQPAGF